MDLTLRRSVLLNAGVIKKMWDSAAVNGLLMAFESALPAKKYFGDLCVARAVAAAAVSRTKRAYRNNASQPLPLRLNAKALGYQGV